MATLTISRSKLEKILKNLRQAQTESTDIDCKLTLDLNDDGNKASFIRHVAAFANTKYESFIIIGIEDKTWIAKGIERGSIFANPDQAQQQINQVLANRIDPPITVTYQTFENMDGVLVGVIAIPGDNPPYVVSIADDKYGGKKEKGKNSYIYKGAIYFRRGTDSVIASRQSEILEVLDGRWDDIGFNITMIFVTIFVAVCVGITLSLFKFGDILSPVLLGIAFGTILGWLFNARIMGTTSSKYSASKLKIFLRNIVGPIWGALIGGLLSYIYANAVIKGGIKPLDPISMAVIFALFAILFFIIPGFLIAPITDKLFSSFKYRAWRMINKIIAGIKKNKLFDKQT